MRLIHSYTLQPSSLRQQSATFGSARRYKLCSMQHPLAGAAPPHRLSSAQGESLECHFVWAKSALTLYSFSSFAMKRLAETTRSGVTAGPNADQELVCRIVGIHSVKFKFSFVSLILLL